MDNAGLESSLNAAYYEYEYSKHGGAVGDITVYGDGIPSDAVIVGGLIRVTQAVTSAGAATVAVKAATAADILAATAKGSLTLNALLDTVPDMTAANAVRLTSAVNSLTFTVAVDALTAGKIVVALYYIVTG